MSFDFTSLEGALADWMHMLCGESLSGADVHQWTWKVLIPPGSRWSVVRLREGELDRLEGDPL